MSNDAKAHIGIIVGIIGALVGILGLGITFATNRAKVDEMLCNLEWLRIGCPATAKLEFLAVEGWAYTGPTEAADLWNWGETQSSRYGRLEGELDLANRGRSESNPLTCGESGYEGATGLDLRAETVSSTLPFGPPEPRSRPSYPSEQPLEPPPPGYDFAVYSRFSYWRLQLEYPESSRSREFQIKEVIRPPLALSDEGADHSVRRFFVRSGPEHKTCTVYVPLAPRQVGTYRVELTISGDITGNAEDDVTFELRIER